MEEKYQVLIVDDAEINRSMLTDMLADKYTILEATNGVEAVAILEKHHAKISLVLLDIIMPEMNGFEVLSVMKKCDWLRTTPVIVISAETSSSYIDTAYDLGATDYLNRPFDEKTVDRRVKNTIVLYAKQKLLEGMVEEQILEKERNNILMVEILSNIVEFRNGESGLHVLHIRTITEILVRQLVRMTNKYPLTATQIALMVNAAALHDIGKISIPEHILNKPGRLTTEEFAIMKTHSEIGAKILKNAPYHQEELIQIAHDICRWHHERYDGNGYPDGLVGDDIPISAQIVALADVYDALTSDRVYRSASTHEEAMQMILNGECGAFNPILIQCLIEAGSHIAEELAKNAPGRISEAEVIDISAQLLHNGKVSNRTLDLLEQERTKYQFFASMSKEVQFEYNADTDLLTLSDWGAEHLCLDELISRPAHSQQLYNVFSYENLCDLYGKLKNAGNANPIVEGYYTLNIGDEKRWYKVITRPLWTDDETKSISKIIGKLSDVHEEYLQLESLKKQVNQDSLTKLNNHISAYEAIQQALSAENNNNVYALILLDLDVFKTINDQYGHLFGDELLKDIAFRITDSIQNNDVAARIGGDEFLIFISCDNDVETAIQQLFQAVSGHYGNLDIAVSMGVAVYPHHGKNYQELFQKADQALYAAKHNGKNQYSFYTLATASSLSVLSPIESEQGN